MPRIGRLKNGCKFWQKVEDERKLESELSSSIPVPSSNSGTFRKYYQSCIARQCTVAEKDLPSIFVTSETAKN